MRLAAPVTLVRSQRPTEHRRFITWARAGAFDELHQRVLDRLGVFRDLDWSVAILDAAHMRTKRGLSEVGVVPHHATFALLTTSHSR